MESSRISYHRQCRESMEPTSCITAAVLVNINGYEKGEGVSILGYHLL